MHQKSVQNSFTRIKEAGVFGNNIGKEPQKPRPKIEKYVYYTFIKNICPDHNPMQMVVFCKHVLIL